MATYKRKSDRANIDFGKLAQAIKAVKVRNAGVSTAAKAFEIPRTSLNRYIQKIEEDNIDFANIKDDKLFELLQRKVSYQNFSTQKMVFSPEQEAALVQYIKNCADYYYYGISIKHLKRLAYEFAVKLGLQYPKEWDDNQSAGRKWYRQFMSRHKELSLRVPEHTSLHRVKAFCKENVDNFFNQLSKVLEIGFAPMNIYNMDETGFPTVPTRVEKIIAPKGQKRVGQIATAERGSNVTMALTVNAAGNAIPPMFLFPFKKMQSTFMDNCTPGSIGFMQHFIHHTHSSVEKPTLLLLDNHTSHLSIEALDLQLAAASGVHMLTFPPHCTHTLQLLDLSVFFPIKNANQSFVKAWHQNNANKMFEVRHVVGIVKNCLDTALLPKTIKSGFEATGICPFNPHIFNESDFIAAVLTGESEFIETINHDEHRIVFSENLITPEDEKIISTPSTSSAITPSSLSDVLTEVGPLQKGKVEPKSNRGRKPMKSNLITSPEFIADLKDRKIIREEKQTKSKVKKLSKKAPKQKEQSTPRKSLKRKAKSTGKYHQWSSDEDEDFCILCLKTMPAKPTKFNVIMCHKCKREVHLKCAKLCGPRYECPNCDSDDST